MTNGSDDVQREIEEIRRLRAEGLISPQEAYERHLRITSGSAGPGMPSDLAPDGGVTAAPGTAGPVPSPLPPFPPGLGPAPQFVWDGSDGVNGHIEFRGRERLSRGLLFVKWLFVLPLFVWLGIYRVAALVVALLAFFAILFSGRYPPGFFGFVRGYVSSHYRVYSYFPLLLSDEWTAGESHPLRFIMEPAPSQSRLLLIFTKLPAMVLGVFYGIASLGTTILTLLAIPMWFAILLTGRYPQGLRRFALGMLQWSARVTAWQFFMTDDWAVFGRTMKVRIPAIVAAYAFPAFVMWSTLFGQGALDRFDFFGVGATKQVVNDFMVAGRDGDSARALSLMDSQSVTAAQTNGLLQQRALFDGYRNLEVKSWFRQKSTFAGDTMQLSGNVVYQAGRKGTFAALLIKRQGEWRIATILIQRPP